MPPSESSPPGEGLNDRIVVVTGAFGALGAAVAQAVQAAGAQVAAVGREEPAKAPAFASGVTAFGGIDLGSPDNVGSGFRSIAERLGASTRSSILPAASAGRRSKAGASRPGRRSST